MRNFRSEKSVLTAGSCCAEACLYMRKMKNARIEEYNNNEEKIYTNRLKILVKNSDKEERYFERILFCNFDVLVPILERNDSWDEVWVIWPWAFQHHSFVHQFKVHTWIYEYIHKCWLHNFKFEIVFDKCNFNCQSQTLPELAWVFKSLFSIASICVFPKTWICWFYDCLL